MRLAIFDALIDEGAVTKAQLEECRAVERDTGQPLDRVLRQKGYVSEEKLLELLSRSLRLPFQADLNDITVPKDFVEKVPAHFARNYYLVSLGRDNGAHRVATCDPLDFHPMDDLSALLGCEVEPVIAPRAEITSLINRAYQRSSTDVSELLDGVEDDEMIAVTKEVEESEDVLDVANKPPIIKLVNTIMFEALKIRASDIHFQPYEDRMQVRYRIDGILYDAKMIPKKVQDAIVSRIKVMGKMDIAERRLPQDGRTSIKVGDSEVDVRLSSVPTNFGERIVMRLLDKTARIFRLDEIGLEDAKLKTLRELLDYSHGIILLTGPTGSGKSTTLYGALSEMDHEELNIITIEDPIEYHIGGISQIQVSNKKGLTFASGLRSLMRQDPDVIMVGEIRDAETAAIAVQAANTGHLVFSTLHTNDSAGAVTRMIDLDVEPYLVSSSLVAAIAQRLVRRICPECRESYVPEDLELRQISIKREELPGGVLWRGRGCDNCLGRGLYDRTAIYEILVVNEQIRDLIIERTSASVIKQVAVKNGLSTLRMDGAQKVREGLTTVEEVLRVTQLDVF
ncbi:MAG TPA: type II secretion system protein GspE [Planctomycetes bacterium]|nr:type II secretion system protein GspE [Planctomycetota bacterium]